MDYIFESCKKCITNIKSKNSDLDLNNIYVATERKRKLYISPVGNQVNFGIFNGRKTPKIIIMGITTSPTARDNFLCDLNKLRKSLNFEEAFIKACILNIFNSTPNTLLRNVSKILNISGLLSLLGWVENINLERQLFEDYFNEKENLALKNLMESIYFTQFIICASCLGENGRTAPKSIKQLGDKHKECINKQIEYFDSFDEDVELLITFGIVGTLINDLKHDRKIKTKCKRHINIDHPVAVGWNCLYLPYINEPEAIFKSKLREEYSISGENYLDQNIRCYRQLNLLKDYVLEIGNSTSKHNG